MKFLNRFIIILTLFLIVSLGSVKAETLEEIAAELNDLKESISNLDTSEVKEAVVIDKALNEITKAVTFVNDKVNAGDIEAAVAAINFADQTMSDIATSTLPKEFETEVIKKGEDFSAGDMAEISNITSGLTANKDVKTQKLVQNIVDANVKGLDTIAISESLNEIGIKTINSEDIAKAISQAELTNAGQALRRTREVSKELEDQVRFGAIIGTSTEEVDLALRQVEVIMEGDPRKVRALGIEKYGKIMGISADKINKGIQAIYSGDIEGEKQISKEIIQAAKQNPDWELNIEINDAVMNDLMAEEIAKEKVVYAVMSNKAFGALDTSAYKEGFVVHDVYGYIEAQKGHQQTISEFANEIGNYLASVGSFDSDTIRDVKYQINRQSVNGLSSKTIGAMVMAELEGDEYKDAYYALDRSWTNFEARGTQTLAYTAARVEAILREDRYAHTTATYSDDYAIKLTDSQKTELSKVYSNALGEINKQNAVISLEVVKQTTQIATKTAQELAPKIDSLEAKVESLTSDKNYVTIKAEVDEVKKYREKLMKDLTEKKINHPEYFAKISSVQAGVSHLYLAKATELGKLQSEIDKVQRELSSTKNSIANAKNNMNIAIQNASVVGVSLESINKVASMTAEVTLQETAKAAKQAAQKAAAETSQKAAEQATAKAAETATAKAAEQATAKAAQQAAEAAAAKGAEQAAAKAAQEAAAKAAGATTSKAAQQAAAQAQKAAEKAAATATKQAAEAATAQAAQQAAQSAAQQAAEQAAQAATAQAAAQANQAAQAAAQQAATEAAKASAAESAKNIANQAAKAAANEAAKEASEAAVAARAAANQAAHVAKHIEESAKQAAQAAATKAAEEAAAAEAKNAAAFVAKVAAEQAAHVSQQAISEASVAAKEAAAQAQQAAQTAASEAAKDAANEAAQVAAAQAAEAAKESAKEAIAARIEELKGALSGYDTEEKIRAMKGINNEQDVQRTLKAADNWREEIADEEKKLEELNK